MGGTVSHDLSLHGERLAAYVAGERFNARVSGLVMRQPLPASKVFAAVRALVRLVVGVHAIVDVNGIQRAKHFRAVLARVRPLAGVDPPMIVLGPFVGERPSADVAGVLLQPLVNVPYVPGQVLLDAIRFPAEVALARPLVRMHAYVTQESPFREYNLFTSVALVRDAIVYRLFGFIHELHLLGILIAPLVGMFGYMLLQL